jgi:hypothetical protein
MVMQVWSSSYWEGWGRKIALAQKFEASLGNKVRVSLKSLRSTAVVDFAISDLELNIAKLVSQQHVLQRKLWIRNTNNQKI